MINTFILRCLQLAAAWVMSLAFYHQAIAGTETITFYHNDISGTPMMATHANGNGYWKESYIVYGIKLTGGSNASGNKIGYAGKPYDNNSRLSYMGARYYSPDLGRFMAVDPVGFDPENIHSFNRYAYANNNPYKYVDPDGHSPIDVAFLVYDIGKLGVSVYTGVGVGAAAVDVGLSAVGVLSPIPGTGQVLKAERIVERSAEVANVADKAVEAGKAEKTYQTYIKTNAETGQVYCGRCSGNGTAFENVAKRDANHHMNSKGYGPAQLDKTASDKSAIRGREQLNIDRYGGAQSQGGSSGNAINGISDKNPNKVQYIDDALRRFGR